MTNPAPGLVNPQQFRNLELRAIYELLSELPGTLRQGFVDDLWQHIPAYVSEFGFNAGAVAGTVVAAPAQYSTLEIIRSLVAVVPAGSTGLVVLGSLQIPLPAGVTSLAGFNHPMAPTDVRTLTISGGAGGAALLWVTGEQAPTFGVMGP